MSETRSTSASPGTPGHVRRTRRIQIGGVVALALLAAASLLARPLPLNAWLGTVAPDDMPVPFHRPSAPPAVSHAGNAARAYAGIELSAATTRGINQHRFFGWNHRTSPVAPVSLEPLPAEVRHALDGSMDEYASLFPLLHEAAGMPPGQIELAPSGSEMADGANQNRQQARFCTLAQLAVLHTMACIEHTDAAGTFEAFLDGLSVGRPLATVPNEGAQGTRALLDRMMLTLLPRILTYVALNDAQLAALADAVGRLDYGEGIQRTVEASLLDNLCNSGLYRQARSKSLSDADTRFVSVPNVVVLDPRLDRVFECTIGVLGVNWWNWFGISDVESADIAYMTGRLVRASRLPCAERLAATTALERRTSSDIRMRVSAALWRTSGLTRVLRSDQCPVALQHLALTVIAAQRYRLAHGVWPSRWNDMVPAYLAAAPMDPFALAVLYRETNTPRMGIPGLALRHQVPCGTSARAEAPTHRDDFTVYSVGRDGHDDSATTRTHPFGYLIDDIVWTIRPPADRAPDAVKQEGYPARLSAIPKPSNAGVSRAPVASGVRLSSTSLPVPL